MAFPCLHASFKSSRTKFEVRTLEYSLLVAVLCAARAQGAKTACRISSVKETEMANLTCWYPEDLSQSKKDFTVYHYSGVGRASAVVDCLWLAGSLQCFTQPGYEFDRVVTNSMTVQIPRVTQTETGKYTCQITGSRPEDLGYCELQLRPDRTTCELHSVEAAAETILTCDFHEDLSQSKKDFMVYHFDDHGIPTVVVDCFWYLDNLTCIAQPGYQPETRVFRHFAVKIRQASETQNGSYVCEIGGARTDRFSLCSILVPTAEGEDENLRVGCNQDRLIAVIAVLAMWIMTAVIALIIRSVACNRCPCNPIRGCRRSDKPSIGCQFSWRQTSCNRQSLTETEAAVPEHVDVSDEKDAVTEPLNNGGRSDIVVTSL